MAGSDHIGQAGYTQAFDDTYAPDDSTCDYFPPTNVLAVRGQGMSSCLDPACDRALRASVYGFFLFFSGSAR